MESDVTAVVLGGGGLLGRHVARRLGAAGRSVPRSECDITKLDDVTRVTEGASLVVNCAAWTDVDGAESHLEAALAVNATGAENAARAAKTHGAKLVHVSTGFVFDGAKEAPYTEDDVPNPLSAYAKTKYEGEERVRAVGGMTFVVRLQSVYGEGGKGFASKLRERIVRSEPLKLDAELAVQPTWAGAAARRILSIAASEEWGTHHATCRGRTTWAAFGRAIAERAGVTPAFQEIRSADLARVAARPKNFLLESVRSTEMPDWSTALREYLDEVG